MLSLHLGVKHVFFHLIFINLGDRSIAIYQSYIVKPPMQPERKVGFYLKMTLHHQPQGIQCQEYLSCYRPHFNKTFKVGSCEHLEHIPTVTVAFVLATFVLIRNISSVTDPIMTKD